MKLDQAEMLMLAGNRREAAETALLNIHEHPDRALMIIGSCSMHDPKRAVEAFSMVKGDLEPFAKFNTGVAKAILDEPDALETLLRSMPRRHSELRKGRITYKLNPAMVHLAAANLLQKRFMDRESMPHLEQCIKNEKDLLRCGINPDLPRLDLAYARMREGMFDHRSWALHESRWFRVQKRRDPPTRFENPDGKTVVVHMEQGFGDNIQFIRFTRALKEMGAKTIIKSRRELTTLLRRMDSVDLAVDEESPDPPHHLHLHTMSMPYLLRIEDPGKYSEPYISPDPQLAREWQERLPRGRKIGVAWKGSPRNGEAQRIEERNIPVRRLLEIIPEHLRIISLQKDDHETHPRIHSPIGEDHDYHHTAAIISALDLVLCVDTSVAHLAAAMGKKTLMLSRKGGCWRWGKEGDTPWYPSMKIYRQTERGDWTRQLETARRDIQP
jgi:hypothetical protein